MLRALDRSPLKKAAATAVLGGVALAWPACACAASGIEGYVRLSPTCPVERVPPDPRCAPRPYQTRIDVYQGLAFVATILSDANGYFRTALAPGTYTVRANPGHTQPRCPSHTVTAPAHAFAMVEIECDTGIR